MSRRKWCRDHVTEIKENCGLTDHELWRMQRATDFEESYEELQICNLTTDAIDPLMKKKNREIQQESVDAVVKLFKETKVAPTRKEVEQIISDLRKERGLDGDGDEPAQEIEDAGPAIDKAAPDEPETGYRSEKPYAVSVVESKSETHPTREIRVYDIIRTDLKARPYHEKDRNQWKVTVQVTLGRFPTKDEAELFCDAHTYELARIMEAEGGES